MLFNSALPHWRITHLAVQWWGALFAHHHLHRPQHVGMFAGSLLARTDWDHE